MPSLHRPSIFGSKSWLLVVPLLCSACIVIPVRKKLVGPGGTIGSVDLRFLEAGHTTRADTLDRLSMVNVGVEDPALFWGRWERKWTVYWFVGAVAPGGAGVAGGAPDVFRRSNLLVQFNAADIADSIITVGDNHLLRDLATILRKFPQRRGTRAPDTLQIRALNNESVELRDHVIHFSGLAPLPGRSVATSLPLEWNFSSLLRLETRNKDARQDRLPLRLASNIPGRFGRKLYRDFDLAPRDLYTLVQYLLAHDLDRILPPPAPLAAASESRR